MAKAGDSYCVELKQTHLNWGEYRYSETREIIIGESYIPIPREYSLKYNILNTNATNDEDILGKNIFHCKSVDGSFCCVLKAQGSSRSGDIYAKQFAVLGDLRGLSSWFEKVNAKVSDIVKVSFISPTDIIIELF